MITLDQVLLLEQKVESAVAKIQQLEAENDALRNKCSELTNALSAKSEQLSSFETDQNKIEQGIRKALDRLNTIENSVLKAAGQLQGNTKPQVTAKPVAAVAPNTQSFETMKPVVQETPVQPVVEEPAPEQEEEEALETESKPQPSFQPTYEEQQYEESSDDSAEASSETPVEDNFDSEYSGDFEEDNSQDNLGFDIF